MMYYLLQGVDGSLSRIIVCFIKAISLLSPFNDKQQASSHILLPTMATNWDYPGNMGGCVYTRCKATTLDCMGLVLITSWKPATCAITPIKLCHHVTETMARSQVVTRHPEQREAEISERDSLLQFIHRGVQYDSPRSRPKAHKHTVCLTFFSVHFYFQPESACFSTLSVQQFCRTVCSGAANYIIMYVIFYHWVIITDALGQRSFYLPYRT